jgi:AcrR family transcriptional regulator
MRMKSSQSTRTEVPKSAGRPRSLTLKDVLSAAIELGLTHISMAAVAAKLGVVTATIYNYVDSRDDLVRLAALEQAKHPHLDDLGQPWADLVRNYADEIFEICASEPQLIIQGMNGGIGPEVQLDQIESFLAAMVRRGFSVSEAYQLFSSVNNIVFGAAMRSAYVRTVKSKAHGYEGAIRRSLAERGLDELPHLRTCDEFADETRAFGFKETLERIIESFANEHKDRRLKAQKAVARSDGRKQKAPRRAAPTKARDIER